MLDATAVIFSFLLYVDRLVLRSNTTAWMQRCDSKCETDMVMDLDVLLWGDTKDPIIL